MNEEATPKGKASRRSRKSEVSLTVSDPLRSPRRSRQASDTSGYRRRTLTAKTIARALALQAAGRGSILIASADAIGDASTGSVTWMKELTRENRSILHRLSGALVVLPPPRNADEKKFLNSVALRNALITVKEPRLVFARILRQFFSHLQLQLPRGVDMRACVDSSARIGANVTICPFCFIGPDVVVGEGTVLHPGVAVHSRTTVGRNCVLKSNAVVGSRGFGFIRTGDGSLVHFPQIGRVIIEDDVEIGACTTVDRPGLGTTRVLRGTKIDSLCHVGHNAQIGPHAVVTACTEIGAGVVVGEGAWIGPNSCSIEGVTVGKGSLVGIGSTVLDDVPAGATVVGSPAEPIEVVRKTRRALRELVQSTDSCSRR